MSPNMNSKAVLVIIDGWGIRAEKKANAIAQANIPFYRKLLTDYPHTQLQASETFVGLPTGVMGNSEVGHMNIGAGRRVLQDQVRINESIESKVFFKNPTLLQAIAEAREKNSNIHLLGLVSDGCVHSSDLHYLSLIELLNQQKFPKENIWFQAILDGRDTPPKSAKKYLEKLETQLQTFGGKIATVVGRFYAMDRDQRWDRVEKAYQAFVHGVGRKEKNSIEGLEHAYQEKETDEFVTPIILENGAGRISKNDVVICFDFRADRMREIVRTLTGLPHGIESAKEPLNVSCYTFTNYDKTFGLPTVFKSQDLSMGIGEVISLQHCHQFRTAETEKYAHVTFFFNGGREEPFPGEERKLIPSPKVKTYDETPAMNSKLVTQAVVERMAQEKDALIVVNFAQPDMVGHTGVFDAAVQAVESMDICLKEIVAAGLEHKYNVFITADHGNVEMMEDPITGEPCTTHTTNPVPLICVGTEMKNRMLQSEGVLSDISPTILRSLDIEIPAVMTSKSLWTKF